MFKKAAALTAGLAACVSAAPCDIYASGGTKCVAAHSTTRALYDNYAGVLYQVTRGSDNSTKDIQPLKAGGVANAAAQDTFCASTTCVISIIYDQSGNTNHLTRAPPGGAASGPYTGGYDDLASAIGAPVTLNGQKAYGVWINPTAGYRNDKTVGIATGDAAEGLYAVVDGTHYNGGCCFDYGNAETSNDDTGNGHMESVYFGTGTGYGTGTGSGPWVLADLENGLYASDTAGVNQNYPTQNQRFVTGVVKGKPGNHWALKAGNAQSGTLTTYWDGARPTPSYVPMHKEGAIILGIGGDNSNSAQGTFYEGVMTNGYPTDATENAVQANIVAQNYKAGQLSTQALTVGNAITFHVTTPGFTNRYIFHNGSTVGTAVITSSSSSAVKATGTWIVRAGLANSACYSFESKDTPGSFMRHFNFQILLNANDGSKLFSEDATYCTQAGLNGKGDSFRSYSFPTHYFRHYTAVLYAASNGGPKDFDNTVSYNNDVSFLVESGFQS